MAIQTVEIQGERYVILPEREFLAIREEAARNEPDTPRPARFQEVKPLQVGGVPASEMLLRDRR